MCIVRVCGKHDIGVNVVMNLQAKLVPASLGSISSIDRSDLTE